MADEGLNGLDIAEFRRQYQILWDDRESLIAAINEVCVVEVVGETHEQTLRRNVAALRVEKERQRLQMLRLLDEAERVVLSDAGSRYTRLREAINEVRQSIGLGPLTDAVTEYPIRISRREAMELSIETRRKVMARMTDAFMDAMETVSRTPEADVEQFYTEDGE